MSITIAIENIGTVAVADVDMVSLDFADIRLGGTTISQDGRRKETIYRYAVGDPVHPVTIFVTQRYDPTPNKFGKEGSTTTTWRLEAVESRTNSVTDEVIENPIEAGTWFTVAGKYIRSATEIRKLLHNAYVLTFGSVAAGVVDPSVLNALIDGLTECY